MNGLHESPPNESMGKALAGSIFAHGGVVALVFAMGYFHLVDVWGDKHASTGSVGVSMVKTIPIPRHEGPKNPLANDTQSIVPQKVAPVEKPKPAAVKAPEPKAIPIPDRNAKPPKKVAQKTAEPARKVAQKAVEPTTVFKAQEYNPNQVYSKTAQSMNSPLYGTKGAGGIDIGPASVLGSHCGAYVDLMRDRISTTWNQSGVVASPSQKTAITFTLSRNGAVNNVQIATPSGSYALDTSAKRAVQDANPLPALPPACPGNDVSVTLWFQLNK
jgi:TonB family protein